MGGEDLEAGVGGRDEHDHHARALGRPLLGRVCDGRLVAMVAVGDQQLPVGERLGDAVAREAPERRIPGDEVGRALGNRRREARRRRAGRSARAAPVPPEAAADGSPSARRACARGGAPSPSRMARPAERRRAPRGDAQRRRARRTPAQRPTRQARRPGRARLPRATPEEPARFVLRVVQGQVNDVVRIARPELVAQLRGEHVVRAVP